MADSATWPTVVSQLKSPLPSVRAASLRDLLSLLSSSPSPSPPPQYHQLILNSLLHSLHQRKEEQHDGSMETTENIPHIALACTSHIFTNPNLFTKERFAVLQKKMNELLQRSAEIKALFDGAGDLAAPILASLAAMPPIDPNQVESPDTTDEAAAAADRREKRLAKEARKQAEATEKRRIKAESMRAASVASADTETASSAPPSFDHGVDDGTESAPFGNFHTYYAFNAPSERLQYVPPQMADFIMHTKTKRAIDSSAGSAPPSFHFLDVGCNEGDLTIALLNHLLTGLRGESNQPPVASSAIPPSTPSLRPHASTLVHAVGVDIDPLLIERAKGKVDASLNAIDTRISDDRVTPRPTLQFDAIDVMENDAIERIHGLIRGVAPGVASSPHPFDLVCCYSITMWIHLNHGDVGLQHFLTSLSSLTQNLILEPQPWHCYRNARERWRRKGKADPPAMKELKWRQDVEQRMIEFVTNTCGMRLRADLGCTKWQRKVLWFERP